MDFSALLELAQTISIPMEIGLLVTALMVTVSASVNRVIVYYRLQSLLLAAVTGMGALSGMIQRGEPPFATVVFVGLIVVLPLGLAIGIRWLLIRATARPQEERLAAGESAHSDAERIWRDSSETAVKTRPLDVAAFVALMAVSFLVASQITQVPVVQIGLLVSLALPFTGLYNMVFKRDIISLSIGLLVMDHGLYLAVVKVVNVPDPARLFVISLYFYTLITLAILVFMLPQLRRITDQIDLDEIARQSELKG
jgi:hydrogenase-4 membrane subunit HyfE